MVALDKLRKVALSKKYPDTGRRHGPMEIASVQRFQPTESISHGAWIGHCRYNLRLVPVASYHTAGLLFGD